MSQMVDDPTPAAERDVEPRPDDADQARLGARLRRLRTERGWSLTALADGSGVSRAMINRVERGVSSPTATILGRLSGAFGLTVSQLLGDDVDDVDDASATGGGARPDRRTPAVQRGATADSWTDPDTGYRRRPLSSGGFPVDVTEVSLPAGRSVSYPASAYAFLRHCIWVVDGELELVVGDQPTTLASGDRIELGAPADVTYRNAGDVACRYVVVAARTN